MYLNVTMMIGETHIYITISYGEMKHAITNVCDFHSVNIQEKYSPGIRYHLYCIVHMIMFIHIQIHISNCITIVNTNKYYQKKMRQS